LESWLYSRLEGQFRQQLEGVTRGQRDQREGLGVGERNAEEESSHVEMLYDNVATKLGDCQDADWLAAEENFLSIALVMLVSETLNSGEIPCVKYAVSEKNPRRLSPTMSIDQLLPNIEANVLQE
jgi:hypothetical protein